MTQPNPIGLVGRVVTPIGERDPGEVVVPLGGGTETFIATSADRQPIPRDARVIVEDYLPPRRVVVLAY